jgi:hypothetical protein
VYRALKTPGSSSSAFLESGTEDSRQHREDEVEGEKLISSLFSSHLTGEGGACKKGKRKEAKQKKDAKQRIGSSEEVCKN